MWAVVPNLALGFVMVVTLVFTLADIESILSSPTNQPLIQILYNVTGSFAAINTMGAVLIILLWNCGVNEMTIAPDLGIRPR